MSKRAKKGEKTCPIEGHIRKFKGELRQCDRNRRKRIFKPC